MSSSGGVGAGAERLVRALDVDPLADPLLHPHPRSAGATAEAALAVPVHLDTLQTGYGVEHGAGRVVDLVVPPEVTGVVIGQLGDERVLRRELALGDEPAEQL